MDVNAIREIDNELDGLHGQPMNATTLAYIQELLVRLQNLHVAGNYELTVDACALFVQMSLMAATIRSWLGTNTKEDLELLTQYDHEIPSRTRTNF